MISYQVAPKNMSGHKMTFSTKPKEVLFCFGAWCFFGAEKSGKHGVETHGVFPSRLTITPIGPLEGEKRLKKTSTFRNSR